MLYAYRDLWPLVTTYLTPADPNSIVNISRLCFLTMAAVIVPLVRPRTYVPVDPAHPTPPEDVHPEQTAPWLFFVFYEFMTGLVWRAWRSPALPYDELVSHHHYHTALTPSILWPITIGRSFSIM